MRMSHNNRGVTILEMSIIAVAIGVISMLAVPRFSKVIERLKLKTAGRDVLSCVRLARSHAVSQRDQFGVYFNYESSQYILFQDLANLASFTYDPGADSVIRTYPLPGNVGFSYINFPGSVVVFKPNGTAANSGQVYLYSWGEYYDQMTVDVLGSTGRVKLLSGQYYGDQ